MGTEGASRSGAHNALPVVMVASLPGFEVSALARGYCARWVLAYTWILGRRWTR